MVAGEWGDLDPEDASGGNSRFDRGPGVVGVDVHVPEAVATDDDHGVTQPVEAQAKSRSFVIGGLEQIHHLESGLAARGPVDLVVTMAADKTVLSVPQRRRVRDIEVVGGKHAGHSRRARVDR